MAVSANRLRWTGKPGHYEVYYLTLTDRVTGVGLWIRYTMTAPLAGSGQEPSCAVWFLAMDPRSGAQPTMARKATWPIDRMQARAEPFELRIAQASLTDSSMKGAIDDVWWDLRWIPAPRVYEPVHPVVGRLGLAKTVLVLPHADVALDGAIGMGDDRMELAQVPGGQAHLWGSKHATSWAWAHCNDLCTPDGVPVPGAFFDGVSAVVERFGRRVGPSTPVVGCFDQRPFMSTAPTRLLTNSSRFDPDGWRFEAVDGRRKVVAEVCAERRQLVGVTYHDPDGEEAYCYNSETASVQLELYERRGRSSGWELRQTLISRGRCHFESGTRQPVPDIELLTR